MNLIPCELINSGLSEKSIFPWGYRTTHILALNPVRHDSVVKCSPSKVNLKVYSLRRPSVGLVSTAFHTCPPTVAIAIMVIAKIAIANETRLMSVW